MADECSIGLEMVGPGAGLCGAQLRGPKELVDFKTIIPIPQVFKQIQAAEGDPLTTAFLVARASNETGYADAASFRFAKWGIEDNAVDSYVVLDEPERYIVRFVTFWDPPYQVIAELARRNPSLTISFGYWEDTLTLRGLREYREGRKVYEESLDVRYLNDRSDTYLHGWTRNGVEMPGEIPGVGTVEELEFLPRMWAFNEQGRWIEEREREVAAMFEQARLAE